MTLQLNQRFKNIKRRIGWVSIEVRCLLSDYRTRSLVGCNLSSSNAASPPPNATICPSCTFNWSLSATICPPVLLVPMLQPVSAPPFVLLSGLKSVPVLVPVLQSVPVLLATMLKLVPLGLCTPKSATICPCSALN